MRQAGFTRLRVWQEANNLMLEIHRIANGLPNSEFDKKRQMKKSSSSIADNIAEGYVSYYFKNKMKHFYIARGEAGETQNHLLAVATQGYIDQEVADKLVSRYEGLIIGINKFIKYLNEKNKRDREMRTSSDQAT